MYHAEKDAQTMPGRVRKVKDTEPYEVVHTQRNVTALQPQEVD